MKLHRILSIFSLGAFALGFCGCSPSQLDDPSVKTPSTGGSSAPELQVQLSPEEVDRAYFVPGTAVVTFSEEMTRRIEEAPAAGLEALEALKKSLGVKKFERLFPHAGEFEARTRAEGMHRFYVVEFDPEISLTMAQDAFESLDGVEKFERQHKVKSLVTVNDPSRSWGLISGHNYGINADKAWAYTMGDPNVIVSIVDGGIQLDHPDLAWNCSTKDNYNFVKKSTTINAHDHGTHVAGIVAGVGNNGKGIVGVAGGNYAAGKKGATLLSCQVFDGNSSASNFGEAIKWGADHGAVISQNSWGYNFDSNDDGQLTGDELTRALNATIDSYTMSAVDYFIKYAGCDASGKTQRADSPMKGGVVVFAAGNDGIENGAPANYEPIVAVGAVNSGGTLASYSNYGTWCDICAPGTSINSTIPGGSYAEFSGTSMACPHVSGAAALIASYFGKEGFTNADLEDILLSGANPSKVLYLGKKCGPYLDVYQSFVYGIKKYRRENNNVPVITMAEGADNLVFRQWEDINIPVFSVYDEDDDAMEVKTVVEGRAKIVEGTTANTYNLVLLCELVTDFEPQKVKVTVIDTFDGKAEKEFTYRVIPNNAPVALSKVDDKIFSIDDKAITISDLDKMFADEDGETLKFRAISSSTSIVEASVSGEKATIRPRGAGLATVTLSATDNIGAKATIEFKVLVREAEVEMEIYPNPVVNNLYIRTGQEAKATDVKIVSEAGATVFDGNLNCSAFAPGVIDMSACAPGKYSVRVKIGDSLTEKTIIKL